MKKNRLQYIPLLAMLLIFLLYAFRENYLVNKTYKKGVSYTIGVITGFSTGAKGSRDIYFEYIVNNKKIRKSIDLGLKKSSLKVGDKVFIEYSIINPSLSLLLENLPSKIKLGDTVYNR